MKPDKNQIKQTINTLQSSNDPFKRTAANALASGIRIVSGIRRFVFDGTYRSEKLMLLLHGGRTQQTTQLTCENRYPEDFSACREFFSDHNGEDLRILSYGCCTGEEVISLREYFPEATIVGAELNSRSLKICRQRKTDEKIHFVRSSPRNISQYGPYDIVFCMAVLQRTPHLVENTHMTDISGIYPFSKFDRQAEELDSYVKDGGLLVIHFAQYDLLDSRVGTHYVPYGDTGYEMSVFGNDSLLKKDRGFRHSIFRKDR